MSRVILVQWGGDLDPVRHLERLGHQVQRYAGQNIEGFRALLDRGADLVLIDLRRQPSHGREIGGWIRRRKGTRHLPLLFVTGDPVNTADVRRLLPDASYADWESVPDAIIEAVAAPPRNPVVPDAMAGYSGTPLPRKLGIRAGLRVMLLDAPEGFEQTLGSLPEGVSCRRTARGQAEVVILFVTSQSQQGRRFPTSRRALAEAGRLWIAWPKKASGVRSDVSGNVVRAFGLERGFVDYKIAAIDGVWSGLCFARREADS